LHNGVLEIIDFDRRKQRRKIADGVKACAGSPQTNSVYAVMQDRRVCRLDAVSGKRLVELGEVTQESVVLVVRTSKKYSNAAPPHLCAIARAAE
jgi:hypothetical protein